MLLVNCFLPDIADFLTLSVRPNGWIVAIIEAKTLVEIDNGTYADRLAEENEKNERKNKKGKWRF